MALFPGVFIPGCGFNPHPGCFKAIKSKAALHLLPFLFAFRLLSALVNLGGGSFKTIKKLAIREYTLKRMNLGGGRFKTIKKLACSDVATFLFCFFIYLGVYAKAYEPWGDVLQNH